ncbi:hypothetical protein KR032_001507, partial [Drosophila birchii]
VMDATDNKKIPSYILYVNGGLAGMISSCILHPLDLVKTRMQLAAGEYKNTYDCLKRLLKTEGLLAVYNGLSMSLIRQATYTTARMGFYQMEVDKYKETYAAAPTVLGSMCMGILAGADGALVGNPAEVALIRMMADNRQPPAERRNYKNVFNAFFRIVKEEGVLHLWRGCMPTIVRTMVVNMVQLASYSQLKSAFAPHVPEGTPLHICAAMCSGLLTTIVSMPLDMAKTRIQEQKAIEYKGTLDALLKVIKKDGVLSLWRGFTPYMFRIGPHTVLVFIFLEQLTMAYKKYILGDYSESSI